MTSSRRTSTLVILLVVLIAAMPTASVSAASDDAVVAVVAPLRAVIPSDKTHITKKVRIAVANANATAPQTIELTAAAFDCPSGIILAEPDFELSVPGIQPTITLDPGKQRQAVMTLNITTDFENLNRKTPNRCAIQFTVASTSPGNVDPTPSNNTSWMEVNGFDLSDPEQNVVHETIVDSYRAAHPGKIEIFTGQTAKTDIVRVVVMNADADEVPGDTITLTADDGDCPAGTVGVPDFDADTPGTQNSVVVAGQKSARGSLTVSVNAADFYSANRRALGRCTASLTASGPGGDSDPSNNTTRLQINVFDRNDL